MQKLISLIVILLCPLYAGHVHAGFWNGEKLLEILGKTQTYNMATIVVWVLAI